MSDIAQSDRAQTVVGEARVLPPSAPLWAEVLHRVDHEVYHLPEYVDLDAKASGGRAAAYWYREGSHVLLLPLIVRGMLGSDFADVASPYGYSGPVSDAPVSDTGFWQRACESMVDTLRARGVVSAFVRLSPLLPAPLDVLEKVGTVVYHGETVSIDLSLTNAEMWHETRRDHRNHINRARRAGVRVVFDDWDRLGEWVGVYHGNMQRLGAPRSYHFPIEHLAALRDAVGDRMHLAVALADGEVIGGNTFFEYRGIIQGHLASTRHEDNHHADKLLYDEVRRWAKDRGNRIVHVGGGVGGAKDSLFAYKAGFSRGRHPFHTWRVVTHQPAYESLLAHVGMSADSTDMFGYFPPYR